MKTETMAAIMWLCLAMPLFAFDGGPPRQGPGPNFQQRKAEMLKRIDERLIRLQQMKACIQAARNPDDAMACRDKFGMKNGPEDQRDERRGPPRRQGF